MTRTMFGLRHGKMAYIPRALALLLPTILLPHVGAQEPLFPLQSIGLICNSPSVVQNCSMLSRDTTFRSVGVAVLAYGGDLFALHSETPAQTPAGWKRSYGALRRCTQPGDPKSCSEFARLNAGDSTITTNVFLSAAGPTSIVATYRCTMVSGTECLNDVVRTPVLECGCMAWGGGNVLT
jgi:hypothetical protein